jgi:hypothetical protein
MSIPLIPGYTRLASGKTLADLWMRPTNPFPDELWPVQEMRSIVRDPVEWLTIEEHYFTDTKHGGTHCVLVDPDDAVRALRDTSWIGRDLGVVSIWNDADFHNGLATYERDVSLEFFAQVRRPSGASAPTVEVGHPFLWYWDAFPVKDGWKYVNRAGREQELIRWECTDDRWRVEIRALEFRQFLATYGRTAVIQLDIVPKTDAPKFERVDAEFREEWAHFDFHALHQLSLGKQPAFSRLMGQYLIVGLRNSRMPRFEERGREQEYASFIYGLDPETGEPLTHTCDPDQLGTYFDKDGTRLHYLTPIYFKREVLQPYGAEPGRYRLSPTRLSCLDLWGVAISFNSVGLVEVYLGDLGRDLPSDEWGHWRTYNVPPEGQMDEGRFRRDFLNQWASSKNIVGDLRRAREKAAEASAKLLGAPIWKPLTGDIKAEFESLIGPLSDDPTSLGSVLLVLTKALVDSIDPKPLKSYLTTYDKGEQSLRLLQRFMQQLGDTSDITEILRDLQMFRSQGGVAHLAGSKRDRAIAVLGIAGLSNIQAFELVVVRATASLEAVSDLTAAAVTKHSE